MHLIESLEFGGAEKVLVHLANQTCKEYKVSVCLTKRQGELAKDLDDSIEVFFLDAGEGNSLEVPKRIKQLIKGNQIDILHSHDWGVYLEAAMSISGTSAKLIHTVHGHYVPYSDDFKSQLKKKVRNFLERRSSKKTYRIVPVSNSIKKYIVEDIKISPDVVQVIHNGIAPIGEKSDRADDKVKLVTVGRLAEVKNFPMMLKAIKEVSKTQSNFSLTIVGDGPEMDKLKILARELEIDSFVSFLGFRTDVADIVREHDVFLCSSNYEGVSIAILEAMSLGLPLVATSVGGVPETVVDNETGLLVDAEDDMSFASSINRLINEAETRNIMGSAGKEFFNEHFHEDVVLGQYKKLYNESKS